MYQTLFGLYPWTLQSVFLNTPKLKLSCSLLLKLVPDRPLLISISVNPFHHCLTTACDGVEMCIAYVQNFLIWLIIKIASLLSASCMLHIHSKNARRF